MLKSWAKLRVGSCFNAAKEIALDKFISGEIGFLDMAALVEKTLEETSLINKVLRKSVNISDILEVDKCTRAVAKNFVF